MASESMDDIGADLGEAFAVTGAYQADSNAAPVDCQIRCARAVVDRDEDIPTMQGSIAHATMHVLQTDVPVRPKRDARITITEGLYAGTWYLDQVAEATFAGCWRCLVQQRIAEHTMAATAGRPQRTY